MLGRRESRAGQVADNASGDGTQRVPECRSLISWGAGMPVRWEHEAAAWPRWCRCILHPVSPCNLGLSHVMATLLQLRGGQKVQGARKRSSGLRWSVLHLSDRRGEMTIAEGIFPIEEDETLIAGVGHTV
jgi:hypothetical protein